MFCSNCGTKLPEGANFCSACGAKVVVTDPGKQNIKPVTGSELTGLPHMEADKKSISAPKKSKVTFDWSNVIDEPQKKEIPEVKSPWSRTGGIDEKELYAEMTPSTDRSRTMSFIDILRLEKETREAKEERFKEPEEIIEKVEEKYFEEPEKEKKKYSFYIPELYDESEEVKTPFDTIPSEEPVYEDYEAEEIKSEDLEEDYPKEPSDDFDFAILDQYQTDEEDFVEPVKIEPVEIEEKTKPDSVIGDLEEQLATILSDEKGMAGKEKKIEKSQESPAETKQKSFDSLEDAYLNIDEDGLFREIEEEAPKKTGMTIAAPADKETEIEALKRRLAELMSTAEEPEEIAKEDKLEVEDLFPAAKATLPEKDDELKEFLVQTVDYDKEPVSVSDREEATIPVMLPEKEDEDATDMYSDALSIEELERDIFGEGPGVDAESEVTKKIDKFYTLYRKNEEFQKLLDEEYNKLKGDGEFISSDEPELETTQEAESMTQEQRMKAAIFQAEAEQAEMLKKETIAPVMPESKTPTAVPEILSEEVREAEEEEEEEGSGVLTVIAVILAVILVILLAVLLILQLAPDSAAALKIDSLIENITSHFSAVDVIKNEFLL